MYRGKRTFDLALTIPLYFLVSPILVLIALVIRLSMGLPVFFRQIRPGFKGRPFAILKFRTMTDERDPKGRLLPDPIRITAVGRFLRGASLDELPELYNVLKGEMSIVGPRPLLWQYLARYTPEQARRHDVKPGITGWAQVNGRNTVAFSRRLSLDTWYVDNSSLGLDVKIILLTLKNVLSRKGVIVDQDVRTIDDIGLYDVETGVG